MTGRSTKLWTSNPSTKVPTVSDDGDQAGRDAHHDWISAMNLVLRQDESGISERTRPRYATNLPDQFNGSP
jgi:hypothetical protein